MLNHRRTTPLHQLTFFFSGVHTYGYEIKARCTCGIELQANGDDESRATKAFWKQYKSHLPPETDPPPGPIL